MNPQRCVPGFAGLLFIYCLLNLIYFITLQPYISVGDELLTNRDFSQGLEAWRVEEEGGVVTQVDGVLSIDHPSVLSTTLAQCWLRRDLPQPLLLSAEAHSEGVLRGTESWHTARIDLVGYDADGRGQYQERTRLLSLEGDRPWQFAQALFEFRPDTRRMCLEISLYGAPGRFQVRSLSLTRGMESLSLRIGRIVLLVGWLLLALFLGRSLYHHYRGRVLGRWLLLAAAAMLAGVLMPQEMRQQLEEGILGALSSVGLPVATDETLSVVRPWTLWPERWDLSKFAHLLGFMLLGVLLSLDRMLSLVKRIGALLLLALTSEVLQFFVPLRTPRLSDLVVDALGIAIGIGLAYLAMQKRRRTE